MTPRFLPIISFSYHSKAQFCLSKHTLNDGGVGFYVRNDLTLTVLSEFSCTTADYEALWIEI